MTMLHWVCFYIWTLSVATADYPCPVGPPCDCDARNINCDSRGLTEVPNFNVTNSTYWWVDLSNNSIRLVPSKAFANLKGTRFLKLSDNQIESIADDALEGSENYLSFLIMRNNRFESLPLVIAKMNAITSLHVDGNPVQTLDPFVMRSIAPTLQYLTFGSPEMTQWPSGVQYLTNLTSLTVHNSPIQEIPTYAFLGLTKVGLLTIENSRVRSIPVTLNMMSSLEILSIDSDPDLTLSGIPSEAFSGMSSLSSISITNQTFKTLPDIFHDAISLSRIDVSMTPIVDIPASLIPDDTPMTELNLNDTKLNHVPEALPKMKRLRQIIIQYSNITSISSFHFKGFTLLSYLGIFYSPLSEIADDAFAEMDSLQWLFLDNTNITTIPKALLKLKNPQMLRLVSLENNKVICNCQSLGWLKEFRGLPTFQVSGSCTNIRMDLETYIRQEIPKCP